jgi:hypothetical protein
VARVVQGGRSTFFVPVSKVSLPKDFALRPACY